MSDNNKKKDKKDSMPIWLVIVLWIVAPLTLLFIFGFSFLGFKNIDEIYSERKTKIMTTEPESSFAGVNPYSGDEESIVTGGEHFRIICSKCHGAGAGGAIGPDLTDSRWLHGGSDSDIYYVIMNGVPRQKARQNPPRGPMPAYRNILTEITVFQIMAWLEENNSK